MLAVSWRSSIQIISRSEPLVTSLDEIIQHKNDLELRGMRELILFADVLTHFNRFSKFLQICNLIYVNVNKKLLQLKRAMQHTEENNNPLFKVHTLPFLQLAQEKMELVRRLCYNNLMSADASPDKKITDFKTRLKAPFMKELAEELDWAMPTDNNRFLAFDTFNVRI